MGGGDRVRRGASFMKMASSTPTGPAAGAVNKPKKAKTCEVCGESGLNIHFNDSRGHSQIVFNINNVSYPGQSLDGQRTGQVGPVKTTESGVERSFLWTVIFIILILVAFEFWKNIVMRLKDNPLLCRMGIWKSMTCGDATTDQCFAD